VIKVFSGDWRGLDDKDRGLFLMMDFRFRNILHLFHGPKLAIFFCIVLHADKEGRAWPGYDLMRKQTGYNKSTISAVLQELCKMEIEGQRVLLRYRVKDDRGRFDGSYRYIIFPRDEEISEHEKPACPEKKEDLVSHNPISDLPTSDLPISDSPTLVNPYLSINHSLSINHPLSKDAGEKNTPAPVVSSPSGKRVPEKKGDWVDCVLDHNAKRPAVDLRDYPEDVLPFIGEFFRLWKVTPPTQAANASDYKLWIKEARQLQMACAEFGAPLLGRYHKRWKGDGCKLTIARPGSLVKLLTAEAGIARVEKESSRKPVGVDKYDPAEVADFQAKLKAVRQKQQQSAVSG
jgi:hypothetical protein